MFKQLFESVRQALYLQQDIRQLKEDVAGLERGLHDTNEAVRQLAFEIQRINEREQHERQKLILQLENTILRLERRLPPISEAKKRK